MHDMMDQNLIRVEMWPWKENKHVGIFALEIFVFKKLDGPTIVGPLNHFLRWLV